MEVLFSALAAEGIVYAVHSLREEGEEGEEGKSDSRAGPWVTVFLPMSAGCLHGRL